MVGETTSGRELDDMQCYAQWLRDVERSRDLALPLGRAGNAAFPAASALRRFVDGLRAEMLDFRAIVESAAEVAALNADQLDRVVANSAEQSAVVERTAAAIAEIDQGAGHVARTAEGLRALTGTLAESADAYDDGIDSVLAALDGLVSTVETTASFATAMESGSADIRAFLEQLRRIARQARLLAINAAIEAAHLGDAGRGFVIVAHEVKQLAGSTADSATEVAAIQKQLHEASRRVEAVIGESAGIVRGLTAELHAARDRSAQTREQVRELDRAIGDVAAIVGQQSASLSGISTNVERVAHQAQQVAGAAQRAARLAIGDALDGLQLAIARYRLGERGSAGAHEGVVPADLPPSLREAADALRARVDADQLEILTLISAIAVSIARNSYEWNAITRALASLRAELAAATNAVDETAAGATVAAQASQRMRGALDAMRAGFAASVDELQRALERVVRVRDDVRHAETFVTATSEAGARAAAILDLIDGDLERDHAALAQRGDRSRARGKRGERVRRHRGRDPRAGGDDVGRDAADGHGHRRGFRRQPLDDGHDGARRRADGGRARRDGAPADHRSASCARSSTGRSTVRTEVAGIVEQQLVALADVRRATEMAMQRVESDAGAATDGRRIELALLGMRAHAFAARRPLGTVAEKRSRDRTRRRRRMDAVFDGAVEAGTIGLDECFDTAYVEITGPAVAGSRGCSTSPGSPSGLRPAEVRDAVRPRRRGRFQSAHRRVRSATSVDQGDVRGRTSTAIVSGTFASAARRGRATM